MKTAKYIMIALPVLIFFIYLVQKLSYSPDDTFIYLQYAKNIASGNGFSFNPGEQSYGVTSPLWVIILTIPNLLGINAFWFAKFADLVCAMFSIFIFYRLSFIFFKDEFTAAVSTGIYSVNAWFVRWSFTGMETSFAVLLVVYIFLLYYRERYSLMFFMLGLFYFTRPEGFILAAVLFIVVLYRMFKRKELKLIELGKYILLTGLPVGIFLIFAKSSFGTFVPNTALGKSTLSLSPDIFIVQVKEIVKTLAGAGAIEILLSCVTLVLIVVKKRSLGLKPFFFWIFSLSLLYILTDADIISRYLIIISPFIILIGLTAVLFLNKRRNIILTAVLIASVFYSQFIFYKFVKPSTDDFSEGMEQCLIPEGIWLKQNTPENSRILVNDVGAIGYYSNRYIIDAAALVNRDLDLNRKIMSTPLEDRLVTHRLLNFIRADYVIDRDSADNFIPLEFDKFSLEPRLVKKFPSLGIADPTPRYFKIYKVIYKEQ